MIRKPNHQHIRLRLGFLVCNAAPSSLLKFRDYAIEVWLEAQCPLEIPCYPQSYVKCQYTIVVREVRTGTSYAPIIYEEIGACYYDPSATSTLQTC